MDSDKLQWHHIAKTTQFLQYSTLVCVKCCINVKELTVNQEKACTSLDFFNPTLRFQYFRSQDPYDDLMIIHSIQALT